MNNFILSTCFALAIVTLFAGTKAQDQEVEKVDKNELGENVSNELDIEATLIKVKRETQLDKNRKNNRKRNEGKMGKKNQQRKRKEKKNGGKKTGKTKKTKENRKIKNRKNKSKIGKVKSKNGKDRSKNRKVNSKHGKVKSKNGKDKSKHGKDKSKTPKRRPRKGNSSPPCSRQATSTFCPGEKATSLKLLYNQVYNFKKQLKRAQNQAKIVKRKKEKKDIFIKDAAILKDVVGGNLTAPSCTATAATKSASMAASKGIILAGCSATISTSCEDISINTTLTGYCSDTMTAFESKIEQCKTDDSCTCWTEAVALKSNITSCNALEESDKVKTQKKSCLKTFGNCKKAQDSAVEFTATCPAPVSKQSTTTTPSIANNESTTTTGEMSNTTTPKILETPVVMNITLETPINMTLESPVNMTLESPVNMMNITLETPVNMTLETPVNMTLDNPVAMTLETPASMIPPTSTKVSTRKERFVQNFMAKSIRNYLTRN